MRNVLTAIAAACLLAACNKPAAPEPSPEPPAPSATPAEAAPPPSASPASTGPLSEAEFKALHQLRADQPPPRRGQRIDLGDASAYLSLPEGATAPLPGIVVIHEWWGLNPNIEHWADRLAGLGWAAVAVDLYGGKVATTPDDAMAAMKAVDEAAAARTIAAAVELLASDPRIQARKRAVIGWCFGGAWSLRTAMAHPELDAAVVYYGTPETHPAKLAAIKAEVLGVFGNRDSHVPPSVVDALEAGLKKAGVRHAIHRYDADHGFANPSNEIYDAVAAGDAWEKVKAFLARVAKS